MPTHHDAIRTVVIERVEPELDGGRYPVKRVVGDDLVVTADIFREGHETLAAALLFRRAGERRWHEAPMTFWDNDRWRATCPLDTIGRWCYTVRAWPDLYRSWRSDIKKKHQAGEEIASDVLEGLRLLRDTAGRARGADRGAIDLFVARIERAGDAATQVALAEDPALAALMDRYPDHSHATTYDRELEVIVDREAARFAAWYELFPRSQGTVSGQSATFRDVERRLPEIQRLGFSVLYFTPIHPIGTTHRKGKNNSLTAEPGEPGSPYAIGSAEGGHTAVHPDLGTIDDFDHLVKAAAEHGLEIALDFAIQVSPDHPWVAEHPEWFYHRPDGTIKYAENPPKKYQDIYPLNFYGPHRQALFDALRDVILFWCEHGVRTFRVDNPHTKPFDFWRWLIDEVQTRFPDAIFLSEAFTRPKPMRLLAKEGFTQSYTYFTWRNEREEIEEYLTELTQSEMREYYRGNLFVNTPDILPPVLVKGGRPAFKQRFLLAATLSSVYGMYSGYELCENTARGDTEYYLDSEMYEYKVWDWDRPGHIKDFIAAVNRARQRNPALQRYDNLRFYDSTDPNVLWYGKATPDLSNVIFVAVNLDPVATHASTVTVPIEELGIGEAEAYEVEDLITGAVWSWRGAVNWVNLDPSVEPGHLLRLHHPKHVRPMPAEATGPADLESELMSREPMAELVGRQAEAPAVSADQPDGAAGNPT